MSVVNLREFEITNLLYVLTILSVRSPSGITYGYTALDEMLPALSKLSTILLYNNLFAVNYI